MPVRKILISAPIFILIYLFQEGFVTQMRLPAGGFSIFLIFALVWSVLSSPEIGAVTGFLSGLLMDLSQSSPGPMGHWTLVMILICFGGAYLGYGDENVRANPVTIVIFAATGVVAAQVLFLLLGLMLGQEIGSTSQVLFVLIGTAFWSVIIAPLILPIISRIHALVYETSSRL